MSLIEDVAALLREHRLGPMADRLLLQEAGRDRRPFAQRFSEITRAYADAQENGALARRIRKAALPYEGVPLADVVTGSERCLKRSTLDAFGDGNWARRAEHMVVVGKSGRGTTYLACALAQAVLTAGMRVCYTEVPTLVADAHAACDEGRIGAFVRGIERAHLLVLDDWGNTDEALGSKDLVMLRRVLRPMLRDRAVLFVSKNPPQELCEWLGGREIAEELVDWLSHVPHRIELSGPSMRRYQSQQRSSEA